MLTRVFITALSLCAIALPLPAQTSSSIVPSSTMFAFGNSECGFPFAYTSQKSQHLIDGAQICKTGALLLSQTFRPEPTQSLSSYVARKITSLKVTLSHTAKTPLNMSSLFAANITSPTTVVYFGTYNLPPQAVIKTAPFNIKITYSAPYQFLPVLGNLLIQFEVHGSSGKSNYVTDSMIDLAGVGSSQTFGTAGAFATKETYSLSCTSLASLITPGGQATLSVSGLKSPYTNLVHFGTATDQWMSLKLPLDMAPYGAPGNTIYMAPIYSYPIQLIKNANGTYDGSRTYFIPNLPVGSPYEGITFYGQAYFLDKAANGLNVVFSNGVAMKLGLGRAPMQVLGAQSVTAAIGTFPSTKPTGVVTKFDGLFF